MSLESRRRMASFLFVVSLLVVVVLALTGCGGSDGDPGTDTVSTDTANGEDVADDTSVASDTTVGDQAASDTASPGWKTTPDCAADDPIVELACNLICVNCGEHAGQQNGCSAAKGVIESGNATCAYGRGQIDAWLPTCISFDAAADRDYPACPPGPPADLTPVVGTIAIELKQGVAVSGDFETGTAYSLTITAEGGVSGDLGSFTPEQRSTSVTVGDERSQTWATGNGGPALVVEFNSSGLKMARYFKAQGTSGEYQFALRHGYDSIAEIAGTYDVKVTKVTGTVGTLVVGDAVTITVAADGSLTSTIANFSATERPQTAQFLDPQGVFDWGRGDIYDGETLKLTFDIDAGLTIASYNKGKIMVPAEAFGYDMEPAP